MMTIKLFSNKFESVPAATSWYLANLGEARGKQDLWPYIKHFLFIIKTGQWQSGNNQ